MEKTGSLWSYVARLALVHVITYAVIAIAFLAFQGALPAQGRAALDFFAPYRPLNLITLAGQIIRGGFLALILYPFYDLLVRGRRGGLVLFAALWGLALLGSVEPMPGSIEGVIYTETTAAEHLVALAAGAVQALLFAWLFLSWERRSDADRDAHRAGSVNHG